MHRQCRRKDRVADRGETSAGLLAAAKWQRALCLRGWCQGSDPRQQGSVGIQGTEKGVECHAAQPLPNGNVLVVECGTSRLIEVDKEGKIAKEIPLVTKPDVTLHNQYRGARKLVNGHYVVVFKGEGKIVELDGDGKVLRQQPVPGDPHEVLVLKNGNWLVTCGDGHQVVEVNPAGETVWSLTENELPGNPLRLMAGAQRLPNGNTILCNYLGHGHIGENPQVYEVTPDKKLVWTFGDHGQFKTINQIQILDTPVDVIQGEIYR